MTSAEGAWGSLLWIGTAKLADAVRPHAIELAERWQLAAPTELGNQSIRADVVVNAVGLGDDPELELVLEWLGGCASAGTQRVVNVVPTAWLGDASQPARAARAAFLVSAGRSLALALAPLATVNTVAVAGRFDARRSEFAVTEQVPDEATIAHCISYFAARRNVYVTGQTLNACGGATLMSSLSI